MRITDDRLDELVEALATGRLPSPSWTDTPAVLLALTELQDRRDDEYDDADENYETAIGVYEDEGEGYLNADGSDEEDEDAYLPPWWSPRWGYTGGDADDGYPDFDPDDVNDDVNRNEDAF
jgi:hypothetical protein